MVQEKLEKILKHVADTERLTNYKLVPHIDALKGDGFFSESYTGEIIDKDTGTKIETFIKIQPAYMKEFTSLAYCNECRFYSNILSELNKFQIEKSVNSPFQNVPKFYCGDDEADSKYLVMENLKTQNYVMTDKTQSLDDDHLKLIFETYGKFHALSFAFKDQNSEKYSELVNPLIDIFDLLLEGVPLMFAEAYNAVKEFDVEISNKIEPTMNNIKELFVSANTCNETYSGLTHGDCWSNNIFFKYDENGKIEDLKLIDFQLSRNSTPIHDLSYFFYSGASKKDFDKLDEYLDLYHKSFSSFADELGSNPEKILPLNVLKSDWKKYGLMGISLGILLWFFKLLPKDKVQNFDWNSDDKEFQNDMNKILKSDTFRNNTREILIHAVEYGII